MKSQQVYRLLYFSGTGNTEYVVKEIQSRLRAEGQMCEMLAADKLWADCGRAPGKKGDKKLGAQKLTEFLELASVLLLAYPTYASDIPKPLAELISLLPAKAGLDLAVVSTCALAGGDCCLLPAKQLKKRGYRAILAAYVIMPNNIKLPSINYPPFKNGAELKKFYNSSAKAIDRIVAELIEQKKDISGKGIGGRLLGSSQRFVEKFIDKSFHKKLFVLADCVKCKLCAESCPMGNISFEHGYPDFGPDCCYCLRCYNFCPVTAIQFTDKTRDKKKYPRYKGFNNWQPARLYRSK